MHKSPDQAIMFDQLKLIQVKQRWDLCVNAGRGMFLTTVTTATALICHLVDHEHSRTECVVRSTAPFPAAHVRRENSV